MLINLKRLRAERVAQGLTQEEMAKRLGWTLGKYSRRERGDSTIGVEELISVIELLGFSREQVSDFFYPKGSQKRIDNKVEFLLRNR